MNTHRASFAVIVVAIAGSAALRGASAHGRHLQCVRYVKEQKPEYARSFPGGRTWIAAADLWELVTDKGAEPRVGAILVVNRFRNRGGAELPGHVAIVTEVNGSRFRVIHSNWDQREHVTEGWFTIVDGGSGVKWDGWPSTYPLRGFVYSATTDVPRPQAILLRAADAPTVYWIRNGKRRAFNSLECFQDWGMDFRHVRVVTWAEVNSVEWDEPIPHLIQVRGRSEVYWIQDGLRRWIRSPAIFEGMGFRWGDIVPVTARRRDLYRPWKDLASVEPRLIVVDGPYIDDDRRTDRPVASIFRVRNVSRVGGGVDTISFAVRGPSGDNVDFPGSGSLHLDAGAEYVHWSERLLSVPGVYSAGCAYLLNGNEWHSIPHGGLGTSEVPWGQFTVGG